MTRNICIDIDGTMSDPYFFIPYLNKMTGKELTEKEYTSINWNDTYGTEFQDIYVNFDEDYYYIYEEVELLEGAKNVIDKLIESGDNIYFVTARSKVVDHITRKWLEDNGIDSKRVYSLSGNEGKVETAKKLNCDFFIEDDPNNAKNLLDAGFKVVLMDSNYNKNIINEMEKEKVRNIDEVKKKLIRISNWEEIGKVLL